MRFKADDGSSFPDWEEEKLKDSGFFYGGLSGKSSSDFENGNSRFLTYMNVYKNTFAHQDLTGSVKISENETPNEVEYGDILFTQSSETVEEVGLSSVYLFNDRPYLNSFCMGFRPNSLSELDPGYMGYCMRAMPVRRQIIIEGQGISRINISASRLGSIKFSVPSPSEQKKIASLLSSVDETLDLCQRKLDLLTQAKKALMQQIFSQKLRFKADDGSDFPEWEKKKLEDICDPLSYGLNAPATAFDGINKYIRITDIDDSTHQYLKDAIVSPGSDLDERYRVGRNDILFARTGASTGKTYLYNPADGVLYFAGFLIRAHVHDEYDSYFVYSQTLTSDYQEWVHSTSMRSGQPGINASEYSEYSFSVPCLAEQQKIAACLSSADALIDQARTDLEQWQEVKKSLLQQMFV